MLEQLMQIVQQNAQQSVVENSDVPNEHNEGVMQEAGNSIFAGLKNMLASGGTEQISALLNNDDHAEASNQISGNFIESISQKFGIDKDKASSIAGSLIPQVLSSLKGKTGAGGLDINNILSSLQGGNIGDTISNIGGKLGLDKDKDGDVDLNDLTKMFGK